MPVNIQLSKISTASAIGRTSAFDELLISVLVGLGGIEPPTSPLSGVRSSHLSYRPRPDALAPKALNAPFTGGAGRDRTGDLLNANQALSQLSYSPKINRGQLDAEALSQA